MFRNGLWRALGNFEEHKLKKKACSLQAYQRREKVKPRVFNQATIYNMSETAIILNTIAHIRYKSMIGLTFIYSTTDLQHVNNINNIFLYQQKETIALNCAFQVNPETGPEYVEHWQLHLSAQSAILIALGLHFLLTAKSDPLKAHRIQNPILCFRQDHTTVLHDPFPPCIICHCNDNYTRVHYGPWIWLDERYSKCVFQNIFIVLYHSLNASFWGSKGTIWNCFVVTLGILG